VEREADLLELDRFARDENLRVLGAFRRDVFGRLHEEVLAHLEGVLAGSLCRARKGEIDVLGKFHIAEADGDLEFQPFPFLGGDDRRRRRRLPFDLLERAADIGRQENAFRPVRLLVALDAHAVGAELRGDVFLERRLLGGILQLHPAQKSVVLRLIVVDADFDADVTVGDEQNGILGIERNPAQIGKPNLDPRMPALPHLEGQHALFPRDVIRLVEREAVDDPGRNADVAQQGRAEVGVVLAVAFSGIQGIERVVAFGRIHVADVVDDPGDDPLNGVELGLHVRGKFTRQPPDPGIVRLDQFRRPQVVPHRRIGRPQREGRCGFQRRQLSRIERAAVEFDVDRGRRRRPGRRDDVVSAPIPAAGFFLRGRSEGEVEILDLLAVRGRGIALRYDETQHEFSHPVPGGDPFLKFIADVRPHVAAKREILRLQGYSPHHSGADQEG